MNKIKFVLVLITIIVSSVSFAQLANPGDGEGGVGDAPGPVGGGAPVGSGLALLISLGAIYGGKKVYIYRKVRSEELS